MKTKSFRDLAVYQRAYRLSLQIYKETKSFPKDELFGITSQIRRCSQSICANIAEGYGRQLSSNADFKRFLVIAKGSCQEMAVWTDYCHDLEFIDRSIWESWQQDYEEISRMLYSLLKTLEQPS